MPPRKKTHGVGAVVSSLIKFLHPSALTREKFPSPVHGQRLEGCQTVRQEVKTINRKDQLSLVVTHHDFKDGNGDLQELHAVKKHFAIQEEGDSDYVFDVSQEAEQQQQPDLLPAVIDSEIQGENNGGTSDLLTTLSGVVNIDMPSNGQLASLDHLVGHTPIIWVHSDPPIGDLLGELVPKNQSCTNCPI